MKVYFIGIGGIGVSALTQYYLARGTQVSGSDLAYSEIIDVLEKKGAKIFIGKQTAKHISKALDLVIYSPAVKKDNPELLQAKKFGIKCQTYPEALGGLTKKYFTIAVAGTHGKSTTTAMLALILIKAKLDPTVIVGTRLKEFGNSNFRMGKQSTVDCQMSDVRCQVLLIEACEHEASFLNYSPNIIVLTNIEKDHLDYYKNLNNILKAFGKFVGNLEKGGTLVVNKDDENIPRILNLPPRAGSRCGGTKSKIINYSIKQKEAEKLKQILKVPGEYNIYNALACLAVARCLKIPDKTSFKALSEYKGCWRRFEIKKIKIAHEMQCACCEFARHCGQESHELQIILDYAHHPTEIKACLQGAREKFPKKKIWCVFQPHQYQRTFYLFKDFVKVFQNALDKKIIDELIITDIYDVAGREDKKIKSKVSSKKMIEKINRNSKRWEQNSFAAKFCYLERDEKGKQKYLNRSTATEKMFLRSLTKSQLKEQNCSRKNFATISRYLSNLPKTENYLKENAQSKDIIMVLGAGDIYKLFN